jgi:hypothetical protein
MMGKEQNSETMGPDLLEEYCFAFDHVGRRPILDDTTLPAFMRFCRKLQVIQDPSRPLLLKNPFDTPNFLYIHEKCPHARYIFIYRHPADIINSNVRMLRSMFRARDEYVALTVPRYDRLCRNPAKMALARAIYSERLPILVRQVSNYVSRSCQYMADHREKLGAAAMGITYTEMCNQPNEVVHRVLDFLGLQEKVPQDYSRLIRLREPSLLPEVQRNLPDIERRNAAYLRAGALRAAASG